MTYLVSRIVAKDRIDFSPTYPFLHIYPYDEAHIPAILDELYGMALDYAKTRTDCPNSVAVYRDCYKEEDGKLLLYNIYSTYKDSFVHGELIRVTTDKVMETREVPHNSGVYGPVFDGDWNVIYYGVHYRDDFLSVYEQFLKGIDPPIRPDAGQNDQ